MKKSTKSATKPATATAPRRGRPILPFKLPTSGKFTVKTILSRLHANPPTAVTVHNHINRALKAGEIERVGTRIEGRGRPKFVFQRRKSAKK